MTDAGFYQNAGPFTLSQIAQATGSSVQLAGGDPQASHSLETREYNDVAPLDKAGPRDVSFIDNPKYIPDFVSCNAGACFTHPKNITRAPKDMVLLVSEQPYAAFAKAAALFYPVVPNEPGIAHSVHIHPDAVIGEGCTIEYGAVVEAGAKIGNHAQIGPHAVIGRNVELGEYCRIGAHVSISHSIIGKHVTIFPGTRVGQDGFGYAPCPEGIIKVPQLGRVIIGDYVEIGANTCIDRGSGPDTVIGDHTKIDNLVQIGHNVRIGRYCFLAAQVGIAGSAIIEDQVMMGGQAGVAGHITVGKAARLSAKAGLMADQPQGSTYMGMPAIPNKEFLRQVTVMKHIAKNRGKQDDRDE